DVAAEPAADADFEVVKLAGWMQTPAGVLITQIVESVLPYPNNYGADVLADAIQIAARQRTERQRGLACWPRRHSSHGARSWDPATVPHPVALWKWACGGLCRVEDMGGVEIGPPGADDRADRRAAEDQTANSHARSCPSGQSGGWLGPWLRCGCAWRIGLPADAIARGAAVEAPASRSGKRGRGRPVARPGQNPPGPRARTGPR